MKTRFMKLFLILLLALCIIPVKANAAEPVKLPAPTGLQWGYMYRENTATGERWKEEMPGAIIFNAESALDISYRIHYYKVGRDTPVYSVTTPKEYRPYNCYDVSMLAFGDFTTGEYYFTVQALGDGVTYSNSDVEKSDIWLYRAANGSVPLDVNPVWNGRNILFTKEASVLPSSSNPAGYAVSYYYAPTADAQPEMFSQNIHYEQNCKGYPWPMERTDPGYYYFKIRALSPDITKWKNSSTSMSYPIRIDEYGGIHYLCGKNAEWTFDSATGTLNISGKGDTYSCYQYNTAGYASWVAHASKIKNVVIGKEITGLDRGIFAGCSALEKITIPAGVTRIEDVFNGCTNLYEVTFEGDAPTFHCMTFATGSGGVIVRYPLGNATWDAAFTFGFTGAPIEWVPYGAAPATSGECGEYVTWNYDDNTRTLTLSGNGPMYNYNQPTEVPWNNYSTKIRKIVIDEGITTIGSLAFYGCKQVTELTIPQTVESFNDPVGLCEKLEKVTFEGNLPWIMDMSFAGLTGSGRVLTIRYPSGNSTWNEVIKSNYCGGYNNVVWESFKASGTAKPDPAAITLWTYPIGGWGNPQQVNALVSKFKADTGIQVTVEYLTYVDGDDKVNTAIEGNAAPDLILEGPERLVANWGKKGKMVNIADLFDAQDRKEIYPSVLDACFADKNTAYQYPLTMTAHCMAINKTVFQAAGAMKYLDEDTHTWKSVDDFLAAVDTVYKYTGKQVGAVYCGGQGGDQGTRALVTNLKGGTFTDAAHTKYTWDSAKNIAALQMLVDCKGIGFDPNIAGGDEIALFYNGTLNMAFCWNIAQQLNPNVANTGAGRTASGDEILYMAFPSDSTPKLCGGIWGFGIFNNGNAAKIEAAKTFVKYFCDSAATVDAVKTSSYFAVRTAAEGVNLSNIWSGDAVMSEYSKLMPMLGDYYQVTPGWADARTNWWNMLRDVGFGNDVSTTVKYWGAQANGDVYEGDDPMPTEPKPTEPEPTEPSVPEQPSAPRGTVTRIAGDSRYETSLQIANQLKKVLGVNKFQNVVLANSDNFADALAGSYLAAQKNAPIIIGKEKYASLICDYLNQNLAEGGTIYILGGQGAVPTGLLADLNVVNAKIRRLEGEDRYGTNLEVLKEVPIGDSDVLVATGRDFADSLSASATGLPILLINTKEGKHLRAEQKAFLATVKGTVYILGGESVISNQMKAEIQEAAGKTATRISGDGRYETSVKIAQTFFPNAKGAVVAYAPTFPDGLCGGPLAYATGSPLLLTKSGKHEITQYTHEKNIRQCYVLGGTGLIDHIYADYIVNEPVARDLVVTNGKRLGNEMVQTQFVTRGDSMDVYAVTVQLLDNNYLRYTVNFKTTEGRKIAIYNTGYKHRFWYVAPEKTTGEHQSIVFDIPKDDAEFVYEITMDFWDDQGYTYLFIPIHVMMPVEVTDGKPAGAAVEQKFGTGFRSGAKIEVHSFTAQMLTNGYVRHMLEYTAPAGRYFTIFNPPRGSVFMYCQSERTTGERSTLTFDIPKELLDLFYEVTIKFVGAEDYVFFNPAF